jgi:hypothetical protein
MIRILHVIGRTLVYAAIAVGLPTVTLGLTLAIQLLFGQSYCTPSNWLAC